MISITPEILVRAYASGVFPMARAHDDPQLYWIDPDERGVLPLDGLHVSRSLRKVLRHCPFTVTTDTVFVEVLKQCAAPVPGRDETWINAEIEHLFTDLFDLGLGHSVECWQGDQLVGGLYGLAMGGVFFGESMFSRVDNASKVALCHLVARLKRGGFRLLDTQFTTNHLRSMGAVEIARPLYHARLGNALQVMGDFTVDVPDVLAALDTPSGY
ncbi:leucyl/phenylalanyl-tRNA--protein transferase [Rhodospirillum rubrum]|uniref:leucyl/phenylalanyl-tRNA--protein transferase n=1 Tax=Rhodospirillum rubrum TaxID=1085 RepID=UPI00190599F1|nr:leucyl/phenylalanyl-tRNA--protein transferase [Rhodospirillum rubrum]MBK1665257.1 leucyl/phenylalanyl-tRNA--protein transferase [Rhodospirillum rubrum]MBK1677886.1 leucyl/phenylalanyl-tRNA--protein transferase [Rhodospirillum rubrum]